MIATGSCYLGISQERDRAKSARIVVARKSRAVRSSLAAETSSMAICMEQQDWMRTLWSPMTRADFILDDYEVL